MLVCLAIEAVELKGRASLEREAVARDMARCWLEAQKRTSDSGFGGGLVWIIKKGVMDGNRREKGGR